MVQFVQQLGVHWRRERAASCRWRGFRASTRAAASGVRVSARTAAPIGATWRELIGYERSSAEVSACGSMRGDISEQRAEGWSTETSGSGVFREGDVLRFSVRRDTIDHVIAAGSSFADTFDRREPQSRERKRTVIDLRGRPATRQALGYALPLRERRQVAVGLEYEEEAGDRAASAHLRTSFWARSCGPCPDNLAMVRDSTRPIECQSSARTPRRCIAPADVRGSRAPSCHAHRVRRWPLGTVAGGFALQASELRPFARAMWQRRTRPVFGRSPDCPILRHRFTARRSALACQCSACRRGMRRRSSPRCIRRCCECPPP